MRIPVTPQISNKDGLSNKNSRLTNVLKEVRKTGELAVVRPGLETAATSTGNAGGLVCFNGELISVYGTTLGFGISEGGVDTYIIPGGEVGGDLPEIVSNPVWIGSVLYAVGYPNPENGADGWVAGTSDFGGAIDVTISPPESSGIARLFSYGTDLYCIGNDGFYIYKYVDPNWVQTASLSSYSQFTQGFLCSAYGLLYDVKSMDYDDGDSIYPIISVTITNLGSGSLVGNFFWAVGVEDDPLPYVSVGELDGVVYGISYVSTTGTATVFRIDGTTSHTDLFSSSIGSGYIYRGFGGQLLTVGDDLLCPYLNGTATALGTVFSISVADESITVNQTFGSDYPVYSGLASISATSRDAGITMFLTSSYTSPVVGIGDVYVYVDESDPTIPALATIAKGKYDFAQSQL